jgi:HTH-type transcriptional regulator/antitoxin HigA
MEIKPIRSDSDHDAALREIEALWGAPVGSPEGDRLEVLVTLSDAWEHEHYPVLPPDPVEAIQFRLEQLGLDHRALVGIIGTRSRVFEIMHRKRPLTLTMIRALHERLGIPADVLIRPTVTAPRAG